MIRYLFILLLNIIILPIYTIKSFSEIKIHPKAGTTSATFLKLGIGSRAVSMGNAFVALSNDPTALYWNPAGLLYIKENEIHFTHNESFEDIRQDFFAYVKPVSKASYAIGFTGLFIPNDIEKRSGVNESDPFEPLTSNEGVFGAYDLAVHLGYSRLIYNNISGGIALKYIQQTIDKTSAQSIALDGGIIYNFRSIPLNLAFSFQNLGTPIKFIDKSYQLPFNIRTGAALTWKKGLTTTFDLNQSIDNYLILSLGTEYDIINAFSFRAGYRYRIYGLELGDLSGLSAGIGFKFLLGRYLTKLDYAFVPFGVLGNSHRISINISFKNKSNIIHKDKQKITNKKDYYMKKDIDNPNQLSYNPNQSFKELSYQEYVFSQVNLSINLKQVSGTKPIFGLKGETLEGVLKSFDGIIFSPNAKRLKIEKGEKIGQGLIYRYFLFRTNIPIQMKNIHFIFEIPKSEGNIFCINQNGKKYQMNKIAETDLTYLFESTLENIEPFYIEKTNE